jgi:predicted TIM-barrel fold metal-dependent hydrolase
VKPAYDVIDFHCHHVPAAFALTTTVGRSGAQRTQWERINARLSDPAAPFEAIESGDLAARVLNLPAALIAGPDGSVAGTTIAAMNDRLAAMVHDSAGTLYGLASVDAFDGEAAAREAVRAIRDLKLHGLFVDCAKGDLFLDCPQARPTLTEAARIGVPVFVHPVEWSPLARHLTPYGRLAGLMARGTVNAASLIALIERGVFAELPALRVVVTSLALGGLLVEAAFRDLSARADVAAILRRNVLIDTMGFHPASIRAAVDLVGVENVLAGSDWPILSDAPIAERVAQALSAAGLTEPEQRLIAAGNARRLLALPLEPDATSAPA